MNTDVSAAALTIAGSDSSGGAGLQADLKTFAALGVYSACVVTAVTAQNTMGVRHVHVIPAETIKAQIAAVFDDMNIVSIKIGMLADANTVTAVADSLSEHAHEASIILDPVMVATSGDRLLEDNAVAQMIEKLLPKASLITPNLHEAAVLLDTPSAQDENAMRDQARRLQTLTKAVLIKGGHGSGPEAVDIFFDGTNFERFSTPRLKTRNSHGTGCTLASAITAHLVKGYAMKHAISASKNYLQKALERADEINIGQGAGPVCHFHTQH